jgi:threonylcarbamoyladenosine tRNA methylthiotransferase MtaB
LFEHAKKGTRMHGFTENYIKVEADYNLSLINKLIDVILLEFNADETAFTFHHL